MTFDPDQMAREWLRASEKMGGGQTVRGLSALLRRVREEAMEHARALCESRHRIQTERARAEQNDYAFERALEAAGCAQDIDAAIRAAKETKP